jgi:hypothetical protein
VWWRQHGFAARGSAVTGRRRTHLEHLLEHRSLGLLLHALKDGALLLRCHLGIEWYGDSDGDGVRVLSDARPVTRRATLSSFRGKWGGEGHGRRRMGRWRLLENDVHQLAYVV